MPASCSSLAARPTEQRRSPRYVLPYSQSSTQAAGLCQPRQDVEEQMLVSTLPSSRRSLSCRSLGSNRARGGRSRTRAVFHTTGIDVCQHRANTPCSQGASERCWATRQLRWSRRARWRKGFRQTSSPVEDHLSRGSDQIVPSRYRQCLRSHIRCSRQRAALRGRSSSGFVEVCHSGNYAANRSGLHRGPPA